MPSYHYFHNSETDFLSFFRNYHPYFPILDANQSIEEIYTQCSLLFWTICVIPTRTSQTCGHLYKPLSGFIKDLAADVTKVAVRTHKIVQALLLLCHWPFPVFTQGEDNSWQYCGLATHAALQMGLHRPYFRREFSARNSLLERDVHSQTQTWLACFIVNQTYAIH